MDVDKHLVEIQRLKSFLLELDEELNEETIRSQKRIEELVQAVEERDAMIAELHRREEEEKEEEEEEEGDGFVDQLLTDNDKLRELLTIQEKTINELMEKNNNLQSALCMLQTNVQEEINMGLLEGKKETQLMEGQLREANARIEELGRLRDAGRHDDGLLTKLTNDLASRNYLIDQLNDEVNQLRSRMGQLVNGEVNDGREGNIDKAYMRSLLTSLVKPPPTVSRAEIWLVAAKALGMTGEELIQLGIPGLAKKAEDGGIRQALSDVWISFLLHEAEVQQ